MRRGRTATTTGQTRGQIIDAVSIRDRPAAVKDRAIPGHWEGDLLSGSKNTCIRDYVHVMDLVEAHVLGLSWTLDGRENRVFCLGSGSGFSVREVIDHARHVTNMPVPLIEGDRRPGDAAKLAPGSHRATEELGWQPTRSTPPQMITDA